MSNPEEPRRDLSEREVADRFRELSRQLDDVPFVDAARPLGPRDYVVDDAHEGEFVPPEPESLTIGARARLGWFLLAVGILGAVLQVVMDLPRGIGMVSGLLAAAGVVTLVFALPRFHEDDGSNGAVL